jgi:signal transduction histidine kinase
MNEATTVPPPAGTGEINLMIAAPILGYLEKHFGREVLAELAAATDIQEEMLLRPRAWVMVSELESVMSWARDKVGSDAKFLEACSHEMVASYGPLALVFRAGTVLTSYKIIASTSHFVTRVSRYSLVDAKRHSVTLRYTSDKPESRLMCLSRQAQLPTVPLMFWNLPPARLRETKCVAHGDDCCEYHLEWGEPLSWRLPALGFAVGLVFALVARQFGVDHVYASAAVGLLVGTTLAFRRMVVAANDFHSDTTKQVGVFVTQHEEAAEEIISLHQRQEAFNSLLAERIEARTSTLQAMLTELKSKGERSEVALRGATHDIRNPLQVALLNAHVLGESDDPEIAEMGKIIYESAQSVEAQMKRMLDIAKASEQAFTLKNERMDVVRFVERVRKNLQALVIARDIRPSVFKTREAPEAIETDTMLFDRVIDNLISNAVKYTERGSIVVEIGGVPDHLTFKISDTGRGISQERLEKVFVGGQRDKNPLLGESHGIGLSSAVRLLDEIGGRLEVMSKPDVGTTIWAHVPIAPPKREVGLRAVSAGEVLRRVVTIRNVANG